MVDRDRLLRAAVHAQAPVGRVDGLVARPRPAEGDLDLRPDQRGNHMTMPYDSTSDTLQHSLRVAELMGELIKELLDRSVRHDLSKTREPERAVYDNFVPQLRTTTYGSAEHRTLVDAMGEGLRHHYAHNRHHPEHFADGINGMTLVDLLEMLADWKAATER